MFDVAALVSELKPVFGGGGLLSTWQRLPRLSKARRNHPLYGVGRWEIIYPSKMPHNSASALCARIMSFETLRFWGCSDAKFSFDLHDLGINLRFFWNRPAWEGAAGFSPELFLDAHSPTGTLGKG